MDRLEELIARCRAVVNAPKGELPTPLIAHASDCALLLAALQALKSPWVEVSERLPKLHERVMILGKDPDGEPHHFLANWNGNKIGFLGVNGFRHSDVTHWSALPKPPGGVE